VGVARFLVGQGARVTVTDLKPAEALTASLDALKGLPIRYVLGEHRLEDFTTADLVIRNPAVPSDSPFLAAARAAGVPIDMEIGLFFALCPAPIIGITGTKGKTTTALLLGSILRQARPDTIVAGNLRVSALEALPSIRSDTPVILELSSFQCEGLELHQRSPHIAVVTNVTPDHLNRYAHFEDYARAKSLIFAYHTINDTVVLNFDNPTTRDFGDRALSTVVWFSRTKLVQGVSVQGQDIIWCWQDKSHVLAHLSDVALPGLHNLENVLAAVAAAYVWGATPEQIRGGIRALRAVPHRLETVGVLDGVLYVNDTCATNPSAAVASLRSFALPIVLIAGGADKGLSYDEMAQAIRQQARAVVLLEGAATPALMKALEDNRAGHLMHGPYNSLAAAIDAARSLSQPGDVVLLAPGCASFGMFANEFERGDQFRSLVSALVSAQREGEGHGHPAPGSP